MECAGHWCNEEATGGCTACHLPYCSSKCHELNWAGGIGHGAWCLGTADAFEGNEGGEKATKTKKAPKVKTPGALERDRLLAKGQKLAYLRPVTVDAPRGYKVWVAFGKATPEVLAANTRRKPQTVLAWIEDLEALTLIAVVKDPEYFTASTNQREGKKHREVLAFEGEQRILKDVQKWIDKSKEKYAGGTIYASIDQIDWRGILRSLLTDVASDKKPFGAEQFSYFNRFSIRNAALLIKQISERGYAAGPVKTMAQWRAAGYAVKKGATALTVILPKSAKKGATTTAPVPPATGPVAEAPEIAGFKASRIYFHISQTTAADNPVAARTFAPVTPTFDGHKMMRGLGIHFLSEDFVNKSQTDDKTLVQTGGWAISGVKGLALNALGSADRLGTFFHEVAHILRNSAHNDYEAKRPLEEAEVDAVAALCLLMLGLDTLDERRKYIRGWYAEGDFPEESARFIYSAVQRIMEAGRPDAEKTIELIDLTSEDTPDNGPEAGQ